MPLLTVTLTAIPPFLRAWPMLESKQNSLQGCHLCTTLRKHRVLSQAEFQTITQAITPFAFCFHQKELMAYFKFAPVLLEQLETQGFEWAILRPFADSMLHKVAKKQLESAYQEWMQTLWTLHKCTELSINDLEVLDVQLAATPLATPLATC
jgi:hypothetical protein